MPRKIGCNPVHITVGRAPTHLHRGVGATRAGCSCPNRSSPAASGDGAGSEGAGGGAGEGRPHQVSVADSYNSITVPFSYFHNEMMSFHTVVRIQPADDINPFGHRVWKTTVNGCVWRMGSGTINSNVKRAFPCISSPIPEVLKPM